MPKDHLPVTARSSPCDNVPETVQCVKWIDTVLLFCAGPRGVRVGPGPHVAPAGLHGSGAVAAWEPWGGQGRSLPFRPGPVCGQLCHPILSMPTPNRLLKFQACKFGAQETICWTFHTAAGRHAILPAPAPVVVLGRGGGNGSSHAPRNIGPGAAAILRHVESHCCDHPVPGGPLRPAMPDW